MKSIYVIDDDEDVREVIVFALENEGFTVSSYENGLEGLVALKNSAKSELPGLIIVDYLMPEMDGITFIKTVKKEFADTLGKIPIIISSAMGHMADEEDESFKDVIRLYKPMDLEDLLTVAKEHCH